MDKEKLVPLYRHWVAADSIKQFMLKDIPISNPIARLPEPFQTLAQNQSKMLRLCTFYALTYVVIEGYRDLACTDKVLDDLLAKANFVDSLRKFRNAVFHFQDDPLSPKLIGFLSEPDSEKWIRSVYDALEDFFEENLPVNETIALLKEYGPEGNGV